MDPVEYFERGVDSSYYRLSAAEASASPSLGYVCNGTAVVQTGYWNGQEVYKLLSWYKW